MVTDTAITPENLLSWRKRLGVTQSQAALMLGVTALTYGRWERGECLPRGQRLRRLVKLIRREGG